MSQPDADPFDFWYAVNNTEVVQGPQKTLEAFGNTHITYYLLSELMDSVDKVRVREGVVEAAKPQIITPNMSDLPLEGFSDAESQRYVDWLKDNAQDLHFLQYGFKIRKQEVKDSVVSDPIEQVIDNVRKQVADTKQPYSAIIHGVESPWEVCLLKLMIDMVEQSGPAHHQQFQSQGLLPSSPMGPGDQRSQIDAAFLDASRDPNLIPELHKFLLGVGAFEENEDRFYALVRASKR